MREQYVQCNTRYFKRTRNAARLVGFSAHQKIFTIIHIFAYGIPADYADEYLRIGEDTTMKSHSTQLAEARQL
jgi:hypothetical protein